MTVPDELPEPVVHIADLPVNLGGNYLLVCAGAATIGEPTGVLVDVPEITWGMLLVAKDQRSTDLVTFAAPLKNAAAVIACIEAYAQRHGMDVALTAELDQQRAKLTRSTT